MIFPAACYVDNRTFNRLWNASRKRTEYAEALLVAPKRIFHPYTIWEDYLSGMWRDITEAEKSAMLPRAIEFTGDAELYGSWMQKVIRKWPISCEHNLTDIGQNRRAFVGHAATCLAIQSPEYVTREAWGYLTQEQQDDANAEADRAIRDWRIIHEAKNKKIRRQVGATGIPGRDTGRSAEAAGGCGESSKLASHLHGHHEKRHSLAISRRKQTKVRAV